MENDVRGGKRADVRVLTGRVNAKLRRCGVERFGGNFAVQALGQQLIAVADIAREVDRVDRNEVYKVR